MSNPSYLRQTVSSQNKSGKASNRYNNRGSQEEPTYRIETSKLNTYSKIFFEREGRDRPLTESELRDSNIRLTRNDTSKRSDVVHKRSAYRNISNESDNSFRESQNNKSEHKSGHHNNSVTYREVNTKEVLNILTNTESKFSGNIDLSKTNALATFADDNKVSKSNDDLVDVLQSKESQEMLIENNSAINDEVIIKHSKPRSVKADVRSEFTNSLERANFTSNLKKDKSPSRHTKFTED